MRLVRGLLGKHTGIPAAQGDEPVAALDNELVEPYLTRTFVVSDCSLIVSDGTAKLNNDNNFINKHFEYDFDFRRSNHASHNF